MVVLTPSISCVSFVMRLVLGWFYTPSLWRPNYITTLATNTAGARLSPRIVLSIPKLASRFPQTSSYNAFCTGFKAIMN